MTDFDKAIVKVNDHFLDALRYAVFVFRSATGGNIRMNPFKIFSRNKQRQLSGNDTNTKNNSQNLLTFDDNISKLYINPFKDSYLCSARAALRLLYLSAMLPVRILSWKETGLATQAGCRNSCIFLTP
jgi:hypothetical protein